ncbi:hypothetical protein GQ43DRAFT_471521 [Delitschia confertaspora ATCC 74209]|uniref:Uncharacterized protein n=1 Tax=Delitschia confertaspora ATCC 74209 TaxID=1513339 RepID=A0A9P4JRD5_9PLEO|nr:hypothetical protein GQ43DRAFT_471521 [Delitschia confertaspora ATCC 74209]
MSSALGKYEGLSTLITLLGRSLLFNKATTATVLGQNRKDFKSTSASITKLSKERDLVFTPLTAGLLVFVKLCADIAEASKRMFAEKLCVEEFRWTVAQVTTTRRELVSVQ